MTHGTVSGYKNHGCRCDQCRAVWSAYVIIRRRRHPHIREAHNARGRLAYARKKAAREA